MKFKYFLFLLILVSLTIRSSAEDAIILNESTTASVNAKGQLSVDYSVSIQINNRRGEDLTHISVRDSKRYKLKNLEGNITSLNGSVLNKLNKKEIKRVSAFSDITFYQDEFIEYFTLRHNNYPYIINYTYTHTCSEFLNIVDWSPLYDREYLTKTAELSVTMPENYPIKIKEKDINHTETKDNKGNISYYWKSSYTNILKKERNSADIHEALPRVMVIPKNFTYGNNGSFKSWSTFGQWTESLLQGLNDLPETEIVKVKQMANKQTNKTDIVKALYYYMQDNTRYINVTLGIGGFKPFPASYVVYNKYGDCKALTNYMKALLEAVNIKSYYTVIYAEKQSFPFYADFPSQQFNHVFLTVPIDNDTIWLECTNQNAPFGYISSSVQNRKALLVDGENSHLIDIPGFDENDVLCTINSTIDVNLTGGSKAILNYHSKGAEYEYFNYTANYCENDEQEKRIRDYIDFSNFNLENWALEKLSRDSASINFNINLESADFCKKYGDDYVLNSFPIYLPRFENPKDRNLPLVFTYPVWNSYSVTYNLPSIAKINFMPSDTSIVNKFGSYIIRYQKSEGKIMINYSLKINRGKYDINEYSEFYEFITSIRAIQRKNHPILTI